MYTEPRDTRAAGARLDFVADGDRVGLVAEAQDGEQHDVLELAEIRRVGHAVMLTLLGKSCQPSAQSIHT